MIESLNTLISSLINQPIQTIQPLAGGCIGEVYRIQLADNSLLVAKVGDADSQLTTEGYMLDYLAEHTRLPVPQVMHCTNRLLLMSYLPGSSQLNRAAQLHAAELLAELHNVSAPHFGFEQDTLIGSLKQPNPQSTSWVSFFREQRLLYMTTEAAKAGRLPLNLVPRLEKLAARLEQWLTEPAQPSLIHGDIWTTNILAAHGRITGFIDPAIYYAHTEIELAYTTLFHTFDEAFYQRYHEIRPIVAGFFEERRALYNLYPLLVHVRLFGGGYVRSVEEILQRFGC